MVLSLDTLPNMALKISQFSDDNTDQTITRMNFPLLTPDMILVKDLAEEQHFFSRGAESELDSNQLFSELLMNWECQENSAETTYMCIFASWLLSEMYAFPIFL